MLFNSDFASNTISSCFFFIFLFIDLYFLTPPTITQIFNTISELVVLIRIPTKEAKPEIETHPVSDQYSSKLYKPFYASYSLISFDSFRQLNNFLFHLFFSM